MTETNALWGGRFEGGRVHRTVLVGIIAMCSTEFVFRFFLPDGYGGGPRGDEVLYRSTWQLLTDSSVSLADRVDGYAVLSTPLPMVVFGLAERVAGGLWAPRVVATVCVVVAIAVVCRNPTGAVVRLQFVAGLLVMPHFLRTATVAYTEPFAVVFVVLGLLAYNRGRHGWSAVWFTLGIASRQYTVAFPVAILVWEGVVMWREGRASPRAVKNVFPYAVSSATLLGWFALFGGLTPVAASRRIGNVPEVQQSVGALDPEAGLFFLSVLGLMFVLPEMLISPTTSVLARPWRRTATVGLAGLLALAIVFPFNTNSVMWGFGSMGLSDSAEFVLFLALAALAVARFAEWSLPSVVVGVHTVMLMKAYPWSKYAVPVIAALWVLRVLDTRTDNSPSPPREPVPAEAIA